ncbi:MAG: hypothetical protein R3F40_13885 [Candidatus Competibacteraceae bacterium]
MLSGLWAANNSDRLFIPLTDAAESGVHLMLDITGPIFMAILKAFPKPGFSMVMAWALNLKSLVARAT